MNNRISPLLTDLYQLTMAFGYWKCGIHEREAVFHHQFRNHPFKGNYALACGLGEIIHLLNHWHFDTNEIDYLRNLCAPGSTQPLFSDDFLSYLHNMRFSCDVDALPEGTLVFAHEPLLRVKGSLIQCQLLESIILNILNFQTLVATKASRIYLAAQGDPVLEFGMRRAQGPDGALSASRAAYIGGCDATSNVLAGQCYGIPVRGTHAHSWVTIFPDEISAFLAYAHCQPSNCILLVDTYDSLRGIENAIQVGQALRLQGIELKGIRLDSGDMTALSIAARRKLNEAGFLHTDIIASNQLDEYVVADMKKKGAAVSVWGVGTHLVTAFDDPALDGVYKLSALRNEAGHWEYKLKLSEQRSKISNPGIYQIRRYMQDGCPVMDMVYDTELGIVSTESEGVSFSYPHHKMEQKKYDTAVDLFVPVFRQGHCCYPTESIHMMRERALSQIVPFSRAYPAPSYYSVGLEKNLFTLKQQLIEQVSKKHE